MDVKLFSTDVLKISIEKFERLKNAFYGHKLLSWCWSKNSQWYTEMVKWAERKKRFKWVFDTATIANNVNNLLKADTTRSQFLIDQLNLPKEKFTSLIKKPIEYKN